MSYVHTGETGRSAGYSEESERAYLNEIGKYRVLTPEEMSENFEILGAGLEILSENYGIDVITSQFSIGIVKEQISSGYLRLQFEDRRVVKHAISARDALVTTNMRLVASIANKYSSLGMPMEDMLSEGSISLDRAIHKYDASKGFAFSTYATWWVRQAITRSFHNQSSNIRVPANVGDDLLKYSKAIKELESQGEAASVEELAKKLNMHE